MSQPDSISTSPARGGLVKKPPTSIYTVLMILATIAMSVGCIFLALEYAKLPPMAARMAKEAIEASAHALAHATSHMDRDQFLLARQSEHHKEAVAAFLEKRAPRFR